LAHIRRLADWPTVLIEELTAADRGVQKGLMGRIDDVVHDVHPVAWLDICHARRLGRFKMIARHLEGIVDGKIGLQFRRAHVREHQTTIFVKGISPMKQTILERTVVYLVGHVEDSAVNVKLPTVVAATDAVFLDFSERERGPAVTAMSLQKAGAALLVAEQDEVFTHYPDRDRKIL